MVCVPGKTVAEMRTQKDIMSAWGCYTPPLVSVCCITYNHELYICEAIDSFLMQETDFPFEILVHDDASTDGTTEIILNYAKRYPDIIKPIIQTENQYTKGGLIAPRFLFPKAKGKYIALCEGDDYWTDKCKLQKQVSFLDRNPEYVITYTDSQPFDESGELDIDFGGSRRDLSPDELIRCTPLYTLTTCFRNVIKEIPHDLVPAKYGDRVTWSLLGAYGRGKYLSDIQPSVYRVHNDGVHSKKSKQHELEMLLITYNALFAYYTRIGDIKNASYFHEASFKLSHVIIGWKRHFALIVEALVSVPISQLLSALKLSNLGSYSGKASDLERRDK